MPSTFAGFAVATSIVSESRKATGTARKRLCVLGADQVRRPRVHLEDVQIDVVEPVAVGQRMGELVGAQRAALQQHLAHGAAALPRLGDDPLDDVSRDEPELDHGIAQPTPLLAAGRGDPRRFLHGHSAVRSLAHLLPIGAGMPEVKSERAHVMTPRRPTSTRRRWISGWRAKRDTADDVAGERRDGAELGGVVSAPPARAGVRVLRPGDRMGRVPNGGR